MVFIISSQWKQAAEAGPYVVNTAPPFGIQKETGFFLPCHLEIGKYDPVCHIQLQRSAKQIFKGFRQSAGQPEYIQWIEDNGVSHAAATLAASCASLAVRLHHVIIRV